MYTTRKVYAHPILHEAGMTLAPGNHVTRSFLPEEVDVVSLTCIYVYSTN